MIESRCKLKHEYNERRCIPHRADCWIFVTTWRPGDKYIPGKQRHASLHFQRLIVLLIAGRVLSYLSYFFFCSRIQDLRWRQWRCCNQSVWSRDEKQTTSQLVAESHFRTHQKHSAPMQQILHLRAANLRGKSTSTRPM